jgi:hypothetical protein
LPEQAGIRRHLPGRTERTTSGAEVSDVAPGGVGRVSLCRHRGVEVDHSKLYSDRSGVHTNGAEEFFSRMRRGKIGHRDHIAGTYLVRYAQEAAWREDHRRMDNGRQVRAVSALAMAAPTSVDWCGYWQRAQQKAA